MALERNESRGNARLHHTRRDAKRRHRLRSFDRFISVRRGSELRGTRAARRGSLEFQARRGERDRSRAADFARREAGRSSVISFRSYSLNRRSLLAIIFFNTLCELEIHQRLVSCSCSNGGI